MPKFKKDQLVQRDIIFQSQTRVWCFLNSFIIHKLIQLFNMEDKTVPKKIGDYIQEERISQNYDNSGVVISSEIYGYDDNNSTLILKIQKNNKKFLHLSIHLCIKALNPEDNGPIHFKKNIYKGTKVPNKIHYSIISVHSPPNKPNSLEFSIADNYDTMGVKNIGNNDVELQNEMIIIIKVLNRLFDEDDRKYYIGNEPISIYPGDEKSLTLTNRILKNINTSSIVPRSNKNSMMYPTNEGRLTIFNGENIEKYKMSRKNKTRRAKRISNKNKNTRILRNYQQVNLNNVQYLE